MLSYLRLLYFIPFFFLFACEDEKEEIKKNNVSVNFKLILQNNGHVVHLNELTVLDNNMDLKISMFKMYLSNMYFTTTDGEQVNLAEVKLLDAGNALNNNFSADIKKGNYESLHIGLGLDSILNASDPASFPNEHPLSSYQTMYWSMLKYRFVKMEGLANSSGNLGNNDILISLHPGTDPLYKEKTFSANLNLSDANSTDITLVIDINELFAASNPFNFQTEAQTHSGTPGQISISQKFIQELEKSTSLETNIQ